MLFGTTSTHFHSKLKIDIFHLENFKLLFLKKSFPTSCMISQIASHIYTLCTNAPPPVCYQHLLLAASSSLRPCNKKVFPLHGERSLVLNRKYSSDLTPGYPHQVAQPIFRAISLYSWNRKYYTIQWRYIASQSACYITCNTYHCNINTRCSIATLYVLPLKHGLLLGDNFA